MATILKRTAAVASHPHLTVRFLIRRLIKYGKRVANYTLTALSDLCWSTVAILEKKGTPPPIKHLYAESCTAVDSFWSEHTVGGPELTSVKTAYQSRRLSERYLEWSFSKYPLFEQFMQLYGNHDHQVILDYGCGPGNDLVGFLAHSNARKVIGIDISEKALQFASQRLAAHKVDPNRIELVHISDSIDTLLLAENSVDYIYCEGVLHHTSKPEALLREFHRILKPNSQACVMVYNADSIWLHLYVAYELVILQERFAGMYIYEAFSKTTDTEDCPISRCYRPEEFMSLCENAGFNGEYMGGYLSQYELNCPRDYTQSALHDERLGDEHRDFLRKLSFDERGFPKYQGKHAGIGGVYRLYKGSR